MTTVPASGSASELPSWSVASAKARLSEVIDHALSDGPQMITRRDRPAVVVVSVRDWTRRSRRAGSLADFFAASPLAGSGLVVERIRDEPRDVDL